MESIERAMGIGIKRIQQDRHADAERYFRRILEAQPQYVPALHLLGITRHLRDDSQMARRLLEKAIRLQPDDPDLHNDLANICRDIGDLEAALQGYKRALDLAPDSAEACNNIALVYKYLDDIDEACNYSERACEIAPQRPEFHFNLGNIQYALERYESAEESFRTAIVRGFNERIGLLQLGQTLRKQARYHDAEVEFRRVLALQPKYPTAWLYLGHALFELDQIDAAIDAYHRARELAPTDSKAYLNIGMIYLALEQTEKAAAIWQMWLAEVPDQPSAKHLLAAASGENVPQRAADDYVRELFDEFAPNFNAKLKQLDYQAPQILAAKIAALKPPDAAWYILDAGCGTGLSGPLLRPLANRLVGVDLSAQMLAMAASNGSYDELVEAELSGYLIAQEATWDVIVLADTLVYFGDLQEVCNAISAALRDAGHVVISLEEQPEPEPRGYQIGHHGRYRHTRAYVETVLQAVGLVVAPLEKAVVRYESGQPVEGWIVTAQKKIQPKE